MTIHLALDDLRDILQALELKADYAPGRHVLIEESAPEEIRLMVCSPSVACVGTVKGRSPGRKRRYYVEWARLKPLTQLLRSQEVVIESRTGDVLEFRAGGRRVEIAWIDDGGFEPEAPPTVAGFLVDRDTLTRVIDLTFHCTHRDESDVLSNVVIDVQPGRLVATAGEGRRFAQVSVEIQGGASGGEFGIGRRGAEKLLTRCFSGSEVRVAMSAHNLWVWDDRLAVRTRSKTTRLFRDFPVPLTPPSVSLVVEPQALTRDLKNLEDLLRGSMSELRIISNFHADRLVLGAPDTEVVRGVSLGEQLELGVVAPLVRASLPPSWLYEVFGRIRTSSVELDVFGDERWIRVRSGGDGFVGFVRYVPV